MVASRNHLGGSSHQDGCGLVHACAGGEEGAPPFPSERWAQGGSGLHPLSPLSFLRAHLSSALGPLRESRIGKGCGRKG